MLWKKIKITALGKGAQQRRDQEKVWAAFLNKVIRVDFMEKVTFKQRLRRGESQ